MSLTWAEEREREWVCLGLSLNWAILTTCDCVVRSPSPQSPVLDLMLCCYHLEVLNHFLTWVLTFSFGTEPHKSHNQSCSSDMTWCLGPVTIAAATNFQLLTCQRTQRNTEKVKVDHFIDKVRNSLRWNIFLLGFALLKTYFSIFYWHYIFFKSHLGCGLTWWSLRNWIVIARPTRGEMPDQPNPTPWA